MTAGSAARIGVNVSWMTPGQAGGMEWYVRNLIAELGALDRHHEYLLVTSPQNDRTFGVPSPRWRKLIYDGPESSPQSYIVLPAPPPPRRRVRAFLGRMRRRLRAGFVSWWRGDLASLLREQGIDLWFCPFMYMVPVDTDVPVVVTIPDLQHEAFPGFFGEQETAFRTLGYQYSCQRAAAVIGISRWVADDIVKRYAVNPGKVFGIPLGLDPSYAVSPEVVARITSDVRLKYRLDYDFLLYPANGWHHKNHESLAAALVRLREQGRDIRLVLTGSDFGVTDRLRDMLGGRQLARAVRHLGYVERADLVGLYSAAQALVFPSLFEGFGLPLLEAMQLGTPVVCSRAGSLPEVGGAAAAYVDPLDPADIARVVARVLDDKPYRDSLVTAGHERVQAFSFRRTAEETHAVFARVLAGDLGRPALPPCRPLIPNHWLRDGLGVWYFHADSLRQVELDFVQPIRAPELAGQRLTVDLDGQASVDVLIEPERPYHLIVTATAPTPGGFHRLEVRSTRRMARRHQVLSAQVAGITTVHGDGRRVKLV
jgi:glycosyltransferase involved in cell wall biosynthesis